MATLTGYPVVLKLLSKTITHKSDVGGVQLDLSDAKAVREAFEQIRSNLEQRNQAEAFEGVTVQPMVKAGGCELIIGSSGRSYCSVQAGFWSKSHRIAHSHFPR